MNNSHQPVELVGGPYCGRYNGITSTDHEAHISARIIDPNDAAYVHFYWGQLRLGDMVVGGTLPVLNYEGRKESNLHPSKAEDGTVGHGGLPNGADTTEEPH